MTVISGQEVWYHRPKKDTYERGLYDLAGIVRHILMLAFFWNRWNERLGRDEFTGLDREHARYSQDALYAEMILEQSKLFDGRTRNWSIEHLYKKWREIEHDQTKWTEVRKAINALNEQLKSERAFRNEKLAHEGREVSPRLRGLPGAEMMIELYVPPFKIEGLQEIVDVLDMFVSSPISYELGIRDTGEKLDLRGLLGLTSAQR